MSLLSIQNVTKRFGGLVAVDKMDLEVGKEAIASIIGPNGAGKSTLFNCITGFYAPEVGDISFDDHSIRGLRTDEITRRGISRTYQNIRLFSNLTTIENVMVGLHARLHAGLVGAIFRPPSVRREEAWAAEEARRLLHLVGMYGKGDVLAKNLSYGDQ
ncbi:MAG: ABC transporter ATP-binding protein, partial [Candidatus Binatia bacterium]